MKERPRSRRVEVSGKDRAALARDFSAIAGDFAAVNEDLRKAMRYLHDASSMLSGSSEGSVAHNGGSAGGEDSMPEQSAHGVPGGLSRVNGYLKGPASGLAAIGEGLVCIGEGICSIFDSAASAYGRRRHGR